MISQSIAGAFHSISILLLMLFSPATLFRKINAVDWYSETLQKWVGTLDIDKGSSLLEAGCGTGQLTHDLAARGVHAYGMDSSAAMLRQAHAYNRHGANFTQGSILALPFAGARFDRVIAASLINVVAEPEVALREMARVCKAGGKVSVLLPHTGFTHTDAGLLAAELKASGFSRAVLMAWNSRARKMGRDELLNNFNLAGLKKIVCDIYLNGMVLVVTGTKT